MTGAALKSCRDCGFALGEDHAFCARCGQKVSHGGLSIHETLHDFWHAAVHADRSVLTLVRLLLVRPGYVAREYVNGKRKRYFSPYAFLLFVVGFAAAVIALSGIQLFRTVPLGSGAPDVAALDTSAQAGLDFIQHHINAVILVETPLLAAFLRLFSLKDPTNFAEHLVLASYTSGIRSLVGTGVLILDSVLFHSNGYIQLATLLAWLAYFSFAASQFMPEHRVASALKGAAAAAATWIAMQVLVTWIIMSFPYFTHR